MPHNELIIDTVRELYLGGLNHREIELEMRRRGCLSFTRRVLHSQKTKSGRTRPGWIERFGWRKELEKSTAETQRRRGKKKKTIGSHADESTTSPSVSDSTDEKNPSGFSSPRLGVSAV